jgi:hypothetical protein
MKPVLTHAQFEGLLRIIGSHCRAWQDRSGHAMETPRDMVDFLVDARRDDGFWNELDQ